MGFGVKTSLTDSLFSELVRELAGWVCSRCGRQHERKQNTMDCSHYWGRNIGATRFDLDNADALCRYPCHQGKDSQNPRQFGWEYQKQIKGYKDCDFDGAYTAYKRSQLGDERFRTLYVKAHVQNKIKPDKKALRAEFRAKLEELRANRKVFKDYK